MGNMGVEGTTVDISIHIITAVLSIGLLAVSLRAYRRKQNRKFLYVCGAFAMFAIKELITLGNVWYIDASTLTAFAHFLNLVILLLFFQGVAR
jgi:cbb3-type cytochrome oxidase subunit 3